MRVAPTRLVLNADDLKLAILEYVRSRGHQGTLAWLTIGQAGHVELALNPPDVPEPEPETE